MQGLHVTDETNEPSTDESRALAAALKRFHFTPGQRLLLLCGNYLPLLHMVTLLLVMILPPWSSWGARTGVGLAWLYVLPPLLARILLLVSPIRTGHIGVGEAGYFAWWYLLNLQVLFCRITFLEELLRIVPMAYSMWLRLWGARVGRFVYWSAGTRILDRSFLDIGDGVVFGAGVKLNPHVVRRTDDGQLELVLAPIRVGDHAVIGGYSVLTAGTVIAPDECTRAFLISPPFSHWRDGRRVKDVETVSQNGH